MRRPPAPRPEAWRDCETAASGTVRPVSAEVAEVGREPGERELTGEVLLLPVAERRSSMRMREQPVWPGGGGLAHLGRHEAPGAPE
eukprot:scaffold220000_cov24-Tisochrysis_lutea.AAC.1